MSFGSDDPGGAAEGIGGNESGIGAGIGGDGGGFNDGFSVGGYANVDMSPGLSVGGYSTNNNNIGGLTGATNFGGPEDIGLMQGVMNSVFGIEPAAPSYATSPTLGYQSPTKTTAQMGLNAVKGLTNAMSLPAPIGLALSIADKYAQSQINAMPSTVTAADMLSQMFSRAENQAQSEYDAANAVDGGGQTLAALAPQSAPQNEAVNYQNYQPYTPVNQSASADGENRDIVDLPSWYWQFLGV